ncbi:MAG: serine/threonine-protein kinase [Gemmataceae bacterium]
MGNLQRRPAPLPTGRGYRRLELWAQSFSQAGAATEKLSHERPKLRPAAPGTTDLGLVGPYRVLRILGEGSMGVVYEAVDTRLDRHVALKVLKPFWSRCESSRQRFLLEAKAVAHLTDDRIVTVFDVGEEADIVYIAMARIRGQSLEDRLQKQPRLTIEQVVDLGKQIAQALAKAHVHGVIHRDVKPANIFLEESPVSTETPQGIRVKLLDFGLARLLNEEVRLTQHGMVVGTPAYMAPEAASSQAENNAQSDLFSLGCILYRMTTGVLPFQGHDTLSILHALANTQPTSPRSLDPAIPESLSATVMTLLEKNPTNRFPSAEAVIASLSGTHRTRQHRSRRLVRSAVIGLMVCLVATLSILAYWPPPPISLPSEISLAAAKNTQVPAGIAETPTARRWETLAFRTWLDAVAALPPQAQLDAVAKKLVECNPEFNGILGLNLPEEMPKVTGGKVTTLQIFTDDVFDLSPVRAFPNLKILKCSFSGRSPHGGILEDISPLEGMPIQTLWLNANPKVKDLSPLRGMPLKELNLWMTGVVDLAPLQGLQLESLICRTTRLKDFSALRGMPLTSLDLTDVFGVDDLSFIEGMNLKRLLINRMDLADLSKLKGQPLERLEANDLKVVDLKPLKGMPLAFLWVRNCPNVVDLTPLKDLPLIEIGCDIQGERDLTVLRSIKSLEIVNGRPTNEMLKR